MSYLPPVLQGILLLLVLTAAVYDMRFRRIPNWLVLAGLILGFAMNGFLYEWAGLKSAALGMGLAFLIYLPLYMLRGMGAGDVKLMAAVGSLAGPANWFGIFILTGILGGVVAVLMLLTKGRFGQTFWNVGYILWEIAHFRAPYSKREDLDVQNPKAVTLPHGVMIAVGVVVFLVAAGIFAPR